MSLILFFAAGAAAGLPDTEQKNMNFAELKPMMGASMLPGVNELSFECPLCRNRLAIYVHMAPADPARSIWHWEHLPGNYGWDAVTISPSISTHHIKKGQPRCPMHVSITKGKVT